MARQKTVVKNSFLDKLLNPKRFKKLKDGWIRDNILGVDWGPSSDKTMAHKDAVAYCKVQGGRLPMIQELASLIDYSRHHPAILNPELFKDTKTDDYYWTATKVAGYPGGAWHVGFLYGHVSYWSKVNTIYARAVRSSQ